MPRLNYRIGHCAQCDTQILVRGTDRRWSAIKKNYRQIDIKFKDGHKMRVPVCSECYDEIDYDTIMDVILAENSGANLSSSKRAELTTRRSRTGRNFFINKLGAPIKFIGRDKDGSRS